MDIEEPGNPISKLQTALRDCSDDLFGDCTVLMLWSRVKDDVREPKYAEIVYRLGDLVRADSYYAGKNPSVGSLRRKDPLKEWPNYSVQEMLDLVDGVPIYKSIIVKGLTKQVTTFTPRRGRSTRTTTAGDKTARADLLSLRVWGKLDDILHPRSNWDQELTMLERDDSTPEWIGLHSDIVARKAFWAKSNERIDNYWFDTSRNYILMRHYQEGDVGDVIPDLIYERTVEEVNVTKAGVYYPSQILIRFEHTVQRLPRPPEIISYMREYKIHVDSNLIPSTDLFSLN